MASYGTASILQRMSYVGGKNYTGTRLQKATASRASGKNSQARPPALPVQTSINEPRSASRSFLPASRATSGRSSAYRAVHEAAVAREAAPLEAQMEARQAAIRLTESKQNVKASLKRSRLFKWNEIIIATNMAKSPRQLACMTCVIR